MVIAGTNVYAGGAYRDGSDYYACLWKNGVFTQLSGVKSSLTGLAVAGTNVYASGYCDNGSGENACYWINGEITTLGRGEGLSVQVVSK
jgi:hypothetical protein